MKFLRFALLALTVVCLEASESGNPSKKTCENAIEACQEKCNDDRLDNDHQVYPFITGYYCFLRCVAGYPMACVGEYIRANKRE